jgi:hypothetical protein
MIHMPRTAGSVTTVLVLMCAIATPLRAQDGVAINAHVLFYGDNTEFRNPFREGETIFGAAARVAVDAEIGDRATLTLGVFGNQRFGSADSFEEVRPVIRLALRRRRSVFAFGAMPASAHNEASGPDLHGPHGLLPPLQRETLSFDRPYEAGLQWTFTGTRLRQDVWLNWQRLNTREHRERFDAGAQAGLRLTSVLSLPFQIHIVHEGGQLFASGAVSDSLAGAVGLRLAGTFGGVERGSLEAFVLGSRFVPDRSAPNTTRNGAGFFTRAAGERAGWRAHLLFWRGDDFVKDEGDPNYLSVRRDGTRYRGVRDYSEAGLTRVFRPGGRVLIHASGRVHRTERHYEYSYRILAVTVLDWKIR